MNFPIIGCWNSSIIWGKSQGKNALCGMCLNQELQGHVYKENINSGFPELMSTERIRRIIAVDRATSELAMTA